MIFTKKKVDGFDELDSALEDVKGRTIIFFTGSKQNGKNWCPDCEKAEPVVEKVTVRYAVSDDADTRDLYFIECSVGSRDDWKNQNNPFRTDSRFSLKEIPTLMEFGGKLKRLSGEQCSKEDLINELFSEGE